MAEKDIDTFLVCQPENIFYLSGFSSGEDARLVITPTQQYLITDSRFWEQAQREAPDWELVKETSPGYSRMFDLIAPAKRVGLESHYLTYEDYVEIRSKLGRDPVPVNKLIEKLRVVKDEDELQLLRDSACISDKVFSKVTAFIKPGQSEREIASFIAYQLRREGCAKEAFDTIAVSGPNAALPHGKPGDRLLHEGDMLTLDYGGFWRNYAGDMTRTIFIGYASAADRDKYMQVLEAQQLGVSLVKAGVPCCDIDKAVRDCLSRYGLDTYFGHGTGHGVGLAIHEAPRLSSFSDEVLKENMVVTVEPGIYIPGWGGIRIEDTVIVRENGCEVITHTDKSLLIL
jgi:Xaa-Pro aminopeptidase